MGEIQSVTVSYFSAGQAEQFANFEHSGFTASFSSSSPKRLLLGYEGMSPPTYRFNVMLDKVSWAGEENFGVERQLSERSTTPELVQRGRD
jgi:hypothetical protein